MALDEEDKDVIIKALSRALALSEENKRLKRYIREKEDKDTRESRSPSKSQSKRKGKQLSKEDVPKMNLWDMSEFDDKLEEALKDIQQDEGDEEDGERRGMDEHTEES